MEPISKKRKLSQLSGKNDGSIVAQLEAVKAENVRLNKKMKIQEKSILYLVQENTELKSNKSNDDFFDGDEDMEAVNERLKEVEAKLRSKLGEIEAQLEAVKAENVRLNKKMKNQEKSILYLVQENTELKIKKSNDDFDRDEDIEAVNERLKEVEAKLRSELGEIKMEDQSKVKNEEK